jgi:CRP-like cAMP-binding protein
MMLPVPGARANLSRDRRDRLVCESLEMLTPSRPRDSGNQLLDLLPAAEYEELQPMLQPVSLKLKQVVHQYDADVAHVYFPITALTSLLTVLEEDDPVEIATAGHEGLVGVSLALGVMPSPHRVICQMAGESLRLTTTQFLDALRRGPALTRVVARYTGYLLHRVGRTCACNTLHPVEERACRWLLVCRDHAGSNTFPMTQEFLAVMLGVRRQTVTVVAGVLQNAGLINFRRGTMVIRDPQALEDGACECYDASRRYYERFVN